MTVICSCCNKRCCIANNNVGSCGVRYNKDGKLYLSIYGYPCAVHIDPVEKKPLYHFLPNTAILSIGTIGCNFKCQFCQNWDISQAVKPYKAAFREKSKTEACDIEDLSCQLQQMGKYYSPETLVNMAIRKGCKSIAFTYNEPTIWGEYAHDIAKLAHEKGLKCVYVTNGYMTEEHLQYIQPYVDALNIDLKAWNGKFYRQLCGGNVDFVKHSIEYAVQLGFWVEVTTLIIPDENDSDEELTKIVQFLYDIKPTIPWHISAFHPDYEMTDKSRTPESTMKRAYAIGRKVGLKNIYVGNVHSNGDEDTYCSECGEKLIQRDWYNVHVLNKPVFDGVCYKCGAKQDGIWEESPVCKKHSRIQDVRESRSAVPTWLSRCGPSPTARTRRPCRSDRAAE